MKVRVTFKDPDVVHDAVRREVEHWADSMEGLADDERESLVDARAEKVREAIGKWVRYSEYITVDFDTEAGTATVVRE